MKRWQMKGTEELICCVELLCGRRINDRTMGVREHIHARGLVQSLLGRNVVDGMLSSFKDVTYRLAVVIIVSLLKNKFILKLKM